jgi:hypothetical protein
MPTPAETPPNKQCALSPLLVIRTFHSLHTAARLLGDCRGGTPARTTPILERKGAASSDIRRASAASSSSLLRIAQITVAPDKSSLHLGVGSLKGLEFKLQTSHSLISTARHRHVSGLGLLRAAGSTGLRPAHIALALRWAFMSLSKPARAARRAASKEHGLVSQFTSAVMSLTDSSRTRVNTYRVRPGMRLTTCRSSR